MAGYDDDDDWTGTPPEGRHTREQAQPTFWWRQRPAQFGFLGLALALLILLAVVVLV